VAPASGWWPARPPATPTPPTCPRWASQAAPQAAAAAAQGGGRGRSVIALTPRGRHVVNTVSSPRRSLQGRQGRVAPAHRRRRPLRRERDRAGLGRVRRQPQAGARSPTPTDCSPTTSRPGCILRISAWSPAATPACRPATSRWVTPSGGRSSTRSRSDVEESGPRRRPPGHHQAARPARRRRARCRSSSSTGRVPCCSTRRAATASRPTTSQKGASRLRRQGRRARGVAARHARRRRDAGGRVGHARHRRRGPSHAAQHVLIQDGVLTDYMWDFMRSRKDGRDPRAATAAGRATCTCRWCG
jgi:hypothetical protein